MVDIETLGTKKGSTIFQIAAIAFDIQTGEKLRKFNHIANISDNKKMSVDGDTIKWWLKTDPDLLTELLEKGEGSSEDLIRSFHDWLTGLKSEGQLYLWGNGMNFDNRMLQYQMESIGLVYPVHFRNDRDVRTLVDLVCVKKGCSEYNFKEQYSSEKYISHDAYCDVLYQIDMLVGGHALLME